MTAKRSALIVATSEYKDHRLAALDGPARDAEALRTVLSHKEIGGFDVRVALNSRVDTLRRTLEAFFADRARDDLLLVHFSGHGLKDDDGQLYLAAADTQIDRLLSTGVDAAWVNRLMNRCRSEKIALFLDCCFAGAFTTGMARRVGVDTAGVKEQFNGSGLFVIAASDAMQYSFEGGRQVGQPPEPSPFTQALVDGLRTGEADRNEDGDVSINELFDYLEDRIRETSPSQTPTKSAFNQVGDWVIARSTRAPSVRLLPEGVQRQLKSEDALDRFGALIDLRDLLGGSDRRLAEAALQALQRLATDDSRRVAASAQRVLDEEAARPKSAGRSTRRPAVPVPEDASPAPAEAMAPVEAMGPAEVDSFGPEGAAAESTVTETVPEPESAGVVSEPESVAAEPVVAVSASERVPEPVLEMVREPVVDAAPLAPVMPPVASPQAPAPAAMTTPQPAAPVMAPAAAPQAQVRPSAGVGWSLARAAGRAAIGSYLGVLLQYAWYLAANPDAINNTELMDTLTSVFSEIAVLTAFWATIAVAVAENFLPPIRLPGGAAYRVVGGNRWIASALLGAVVGVTVGLIVQIVYLTSRFGSTGDFGPDIVICPAIGFVIAELIVGRRFAGKREAPAVAA